MRVLWAVVLVLAWLSIEPARAWPWTTPEECESEHGVKAMGEKSTSAIFAACLWVYGAKQTPLDVQKGKCFLDRVDEPRSEAAFAVLLWQCHRSAAERHPLHAMAYQIAAPRVTLPEGCKWDLNSAPNYFELSDVDWNAEVYLQAERCQKARDAQ